MIFTSLLLALVLTIIIEEIVVALSGLRLKQLFLVVALINCITNPIANYLVILNNKFIFIKPSLMLIIPIELFIIFIEWRILEYAFPNRIEKRSFFKLSIIMNSSSFLIGLIIFGLP